MVNWFCAMANDDKIGTRVKQKKLILKELVENIIIILLQK